MVGRYAMFAPIGWGGMATVHLGRQLGPHGFERTVAIKQLHAHLAEDPALVAGLIDEARIVSRIQHPNVVTMLDVVEAGAGRILLVMEYVEGVALGTLVQAALRASGRAPPVAIVVAIVAGVLRGLHAAHEAKVNGESLNIVHRDVSPQNVLVDKHGVARIVDFGIAKAIGRLAESTCQGQVKGKLPYMAPEQLRPGGVVTRRTDIYGAGIVLWEALTARRLFDRGVTELMAPTRPVAPAPSEVDASIPRSLDEVVLTALAADPSHRYADAGAMASALEAAVPSASAQEVERWVLSVAAGDFAVSARRLHIAESMTLPEPSPNAAATKAPLVVERPRTWSGEFSSRHATLGGMAIVLSLALTFFFFAREPARTAAAGIERPEAKAAAEPVEAAAPSISAPSSGEELAPIVTSPPLTPKPRSTPRGTAPIDCSVPFRMERGIKVFKAECLRR